MTDRRAVPSILKSSPPTVPRPGRFVGSGFWARSIDPSSSRALASQAVRTPFDSVSNAAIEILKERPPRDYAADLVEMIHGTIRYEVQPVSGPNSRGALAIDAPRFRMLRTYDVPHAFELHPSFRGYVGYDANGLPIVCVGPGAGQHAHVCREPSSRRGQAPGDRGPHGQAAGHGHRDRPHADGRRHLRHRGDQPAGAGRERQHHPRPQGGRRRASEPWRR